METIRPGRLKLFSTRRSLPIHKVTTPLARTAVGGRPHRRRLARTGGALAVEDGLGLSGLALLRTTSVVAVVTCRLTCAVAWLRSVPTMRFAALSHMLMKGFFFSMTCLCQAVSGRCG